MKKAPIYRGPIYLDIVNTAIIALLAPLGVRMPPPLLINYLYLVCHCTANMKCIDDFAKFFYLFPSILQQNVRFLGMSELFCFILPGLNNSGPQHWQTRWET